MNGSQCIMIPVQWLPTSIKIELSSLGARLFCAGFLLRIQGLNWTLRVFDFPVDFAWVIPAFLLLAPFQRGSFQNGSKSNLMGHCILNVPHDMPLLFANMNMISAFGWETRHFAMIALGVYCSALFEVRKCSASGHVVATMGPVITIHVVNWHW